MAFDASLRERLGSAEAGLLDDLLRRLIALEPKVGGTD
jgi:hypothetical protein